MQWWARLRFAHPTDSDVIRGAWEYERKERTPRFEWHAKIVLRCRADRAERPHQAEIDHQRERGREQREHEQRQLMTVPARRIAPAPSISMR
jgi:hypothetical protein